MSSFLDSIEPKRREQLLQLAASRLQAAPPPPPPPAAGQLAATDAARLRLRAHTLTEENASLRRNLQVMVAQAKRSEADLQALRRTSAAKQQRAEQKHATTAAVLEEQAARQQRALLDLARTAQSLAAENAQLHGRLAALQDENQDAERAQHALKERLAQLQHLCLELDRQPAGAGSSGGHPGCSVAAEGEGAAAGSGRQAVLLERLSCTLRALGPANASPLVSPVAAGLPPAVAPAKVQAAAKGLPTDLRLALRELEGLRRERDGLAARLKAAEAQATKLGSEQEQARQSLVRERHAAAATAELQRQLKTARERGEGLAKRCREKEAALAERDAYVAALEQRLLRRRKPGAAGTAGNDGSPGAPPAANIRQRASNAGVSEETPQGLAALSPCPGSPANQWQPADGWEGQPELSLAGLQHAAEATAAACMEGGGFSMGRWVPSPGADSTIAADLPQQDPPQRRLQWADAPSPGPQQAQQALQHDRRAQWQGEDEWCAYQLGSPSPCPAYHQARLVRQGASGPAAASGISSNPLFSFHPRAGVVAGMDDAGAAAAAAVGQGSTYVNDLYCGGSLAEAAELPLPRGLPLPPHKRLGAAAAAAAGWLPVAVPQRAGTGSSRQQQVGRFAPASCPSSASSPVELGALPVRMPSGEFESVSALLVALTPCSQAALGAAPAEQRAAANAAPSRRAAEPPAAARYPSAGVHAAAVAAVERTPPAVLLAGPRPVSGNKHMEGSVERKLQDAVASFFAETAQKGGRPPPELVPPPPSYRSGRRPGSAERIASLSALAKRQQRRRPAGEQDEAAQGPAVRQGRPNRAADQQAGRGRQQQGAGNWSPATAVCYA